MSMIGKRLAHHEINSAVQRVILILTTLVFISTIFFTGCDYYEVPFTREHNIVVDNAVLGFWEGIDSDDIKIMILKYSETEYLIHAIDGITEIYYRGYPIKIGDVSCVQLQIINTPEEKNPFTIVLYQLENDILEVKTINTNLVGNNLKESNALKEAFLKHKDNNNLFTSELGFIFKQISKKQYDRK